mmetsp:Transcript_23900/g.53550  ORF Transcript_23900/g.53550 Transcript_23900/m.53550 type:complete len:226 (+) Transcript_23900:1115-1792(+)
MDDVLVDHYAAQNSAILDVTPWDLLDLGVSLHINLLPSIGVDHDGRDGIHSQVNHQAAKPVRVLGTHARGDDLCHGLSVIQINRERHLLRMCQRSVKGHEVRLCDNTRMNLSVKEGFCNMQQFSREDDDRSRSISNLFVLRSTEFNHALGSRMLHVNFSENGMAIVGHHDSSHGIQQHLQHRLGTQGGAYNIGHSLRRCYVCRLRILPCLPLCPFVHHHDGSRHC